jgi:hypothetical protein
VAFNHRNPPPAASASSFAANAGLKTKGPLSLSASAGQESGTLLGYPHIPADTIIS